MTLLPPLSPFGPVPALLPFPSLGRSRLQSTPSPVAWFCIAAPPITCTGCAQRDWTAGSSQPAVMRFNYARSLRLPYGFQCFPLLNHLKVPNYSFLPIDPRSYEQTSPVI